MSRAKTKVQVKRNVAQVAITKEGIGGILGIPSGDKIVDITYDGVTETLRLLVESKTFNPVTEGDTIPTITASITVDGSGTRKFKWGEYLPLDK